MTRLMIAAAGIVVAAALFVLLRPGDDGATETTTTPTGATTLTTTVPPPPPAPPPPARVQIDVRDGRSVGGVRRITVGKARRVILIVDADVFDHVHVHGYDLMRDVAPGSPARLAFRATIVGTVEVELEDRGVVIATVTTRP
jgi:hypothetical protein